MFETASGEYGKFLPALDVNDGLKRVMNKKKLYWSLLGRFNSRKMVEDLVAAIEAGNFDLIVETAHAIKGASSNLGLISMTEVMIEVESRAKSKQGNSDLIAKINETLVKTEDAVSELLTMPVD